MMNRGVMDRQMFRKGGAAGFPDKNNDGKITQADILLGRGVEFKQEGGIAGMMAPPPAPMPPMAAPAPEPQAMDPQVLETVLASAQQEIGDLDQAEDFETVMNTIRGDEAPIEERYAELAQIVGQEDANRTPESVLTLVQPAMVMASVDQGIGGLAQEEMTQQVSGPMAQGIMSNVAPPTAPEPAPMPMEGPPPVNFKEGGLVRRGDNQPVQHFDNGGVTLPVGSFLNVGQPFTINTFTPYLDENLLRNIDAAQNQAAARAALSPAAAAGLPEPTPSDKDRLRTLFDARREMYREYGLGDPESRAADLEEQKNLTQAQMLFDIANTAAAFAAPMQGERSGMSPAERLAMAVTQTQLPQTIGARAQQQLEAKRAAEKESRTVDLAALSAAESELTRQKTAEDAETVARIKAKDTGTVKATKPFLTTKSIVIDEVTYPANTLVNLRPDQVAQTTPDALTPYKADGEAAAKKPYTVIAENGVEFEGQTVERGSTLVVSSDEANTIDGFGTSVIPYNKPENKNDVNILLPNNTIVTLTPGTDKYVNAITPVSEGGLGGVLSGAKTVDKPLAAKPIEVRRDGKIVERLDLSLPADRVKYASLGSDVTTHTIGTYNEKDPKNAVWKEIRDGTTGKLLNIVDTTTEEGKNAVATAATNGQEVFNIGTYSEEKADLGTKLVVNTKPVTVNGEIVAAGTPLYLTDAEIAAVKTNSGAGSLRNYEKADKPPNLFGSGDAGRALNYFSVATNADGVKAIDAYAAGADDPVMDSQIAIYTAATPDARGVMVKRQLPDFVSDAIKKRLLADPEAVSPVPLATLNLTASELAQLQPTQDVPLLNTDGTVNIERATASPTFIITGVDYTKSQGFVSTLNRVFNQFAGQAAELGLGSGYAGDTGKITGKADKQLKALGRKTINVARAGVDGRVFALDLELLRDEVEGYYPGGAKTDVSALEQLRAVRTTLASNYARAKFVIDENAKSPGAFDKATVGAAKLAMRDTEQLIAEYTAAILAYEANINTAPAAAASNAAPSVTSALPRGTATTGP